MTNLEIAQQSPLRPIVEIADKLELGADAYDQIGKHVAKLTHDEVNRLLAAPKRGNLILVTAINPTPAGEGKTTMTVGLTQGLAHRGHKAIAAIREPALGPTFGIKGGASGGGYSQVGPMETINLFFTGDFPAITAAHNLLSAAVDARLHHNIEPKLDVREIWWPRAVDMIDRSLRDIIIGLGTGNGPMRSDAFVITPASEIMASLCLATSLGDLKRRMSRIVVGLHTNSTPANGEEIQVAGAMAALLRDAIRPNLVQTLEGSPAFVHGGPFGNIAHGCSSLIATRCALALGDFVITEAGFGSDLGGEKFLNIVSPQLGFGPDAIVVVATVRALKFHGGGDLSVGCANLGRHVAHVRQYGPPVVVAINRFKDDTPEEIAELIGYARSLGVEAVLADPWMGGGGGCVDLADAVHRASCEPSDFRSIYAADDSVETKLDKVVRNVYGGESFKLTAKAKKDLAWLTANGFDRLPICVAKTQYSLSDDPKKINAPSGFGITVKNIKLSAGAGFLVVVCGDILLMPGMGAVPAAVNIDVDGDGVISGLN